jgi:hypothetical protein
VSWAGGFSAGLRSANTLATPAEALSLGPTWLFKSGITLLLSLIVAELSTCSAEMLLLLHGSTFAAQLRLFQT